MQRAVVTALAAGLLVMSIVGATGQSPAPYVLQHEWEGYMACGAHLWGAGAVDCAVAEPKHEIIRSFFVTPGLRSIVLAADWEPEPTTLSLATVQDNSTVPALTVRLVHAESGYPYGTWDDAPPIEAIVGPEVGGDFRFSNLTEETELRFEVKASGGWGGLALEQPFTVYWHEYYWEEADEDASALP